MNGIRSNDYAEAVNRVRNSRLFFHMMYETDAVKGKRLVNMTRAEMIEHEIIHPRGGPTFSFTQAANRQFQRLEELNPKLAVEGFRAIGTISEAILTAWQSMRDTVTTLVKIDETELDNRLANGETMADIIDKAAQEANKNGS